MDYTPSSSELTMSVAEIASAGPPPIELPLPLPTLSTVTARQAAFRAGPAEKAPRVTVDWAGAGVRLHVELRGVSLFDGHVEQTTTVNACSLEPIGPWTEIGRETNEHAELIVLEQMLDYDFTLQRE